MKKPLMSLFVACVLVAAGSYAVVEPLLAQPGDDMFISVDTDSFDPGLAVGESFPEILAVYQGNRITGIDDFMGENGAVLFANRSVDW